MNKEDAAMCARRGADIIGFVVDYPAPVPWNISAGLARWLIASVPKPAETCVVTGGDIDKTLRLVLETKPDYVQLHGGETLAGTVYLSEKINGRGVKIIKTLFPNTPDIIKTAEEFCRAGVFALLLDPRAPENAARGAAADIGLYIRLREAAKCPVIFAGGVTPENAAETVKTTGARMIDLMTGVEKSPGVKDEAKVAALFEALRE